MGKRALITGITGQDAAYLAEFLLGKGYEVYGAFRRSASMNVWRLEALGVADEIRFVPMDLLEFSNILRMLERVKPDEIYNLAAQSYVGLSFEEPIYTGDVDGLGVARLLEAVRVVDMRIRFYQASSSEMFGKAREWPQTENTPFHPRSPYGVAKLYAHWMTVNYREAFGLQASSGILFNHESPLRGLDFVTRKITVGLTQIRRGIQDVLELGTLDARRDWGFAGDYVLGMWHMLQQPEGDDYVLATGHDHSVQEFAQQAAAAAGFELEWEGDGANSRGIDRRTGRVIIRVNPQLSRPAEVEHLVGNAEKARIKLEWVPKVTFAQLVEMMVEADMERATRGTIRY